MESVAHMLRAASFALRYGLAFSTASIFYDWPIRFFRIRFFGLALNKNSLNPYIRFLDSFDSYVALRYYSQLI